MTRKLRNILRAIKYTLRSKRWGLDTDNPPNDTWEPEAETLNGFIVSPSGERVYMKASRWLDRIQIKTIYLDPDDYIFLH